ncbi:MAG TPA: GNAT family N-acetyltransferase [Niastella sp.]|nr:GNAT family N-acetyltransferase [Niastella sp.]
MYTATKTANELYKSPASEVKSKTLIATGARLNDNDSIELITGDAVIALLSNDSGFRQSWDLLFDSCPWATVFQSSAFVVAWYQHHSNEHCPVLVRHIEHGQLKGVLAMVMMDTPGHHKPAKTKGGRITAAGHYDGLYQTWLATPANGDTFISKALTAIMKQFPAHTITLRFIPPGTPMNWLKNDSKWQQYSIIQSHARPLINLKTANDEKIFQRKKHFKQKLNRLKRLGEVELETITDLQRFASALNEMAIMYDFRQSALFNKSPFKENPAKKEFLLELLRQQLLHVTVLKVNAEIIAAIIAVGEKDKKEWMFLAGLNCHSSVYARSYSPGLLQFIMLSQQLADEGYTYFDLSPGYDAYKEELANEHDEVYELVISSKPVFRMKRRLRKWAHSRLIAWGKRPMSVELSIKHYSYLAKHRTPASLIKQLFKRLEKKEKLQRFWLQSYALLSANRIMLNKDKITDLQQFTTPKRSGLTTWEFLSDAVYRLERGQHCYSWVENGCLMGCVWFNCQDAQPAKNEGQQETDNTLEFTGLYYHTTARNRLKNFIIEVINAAVNKEKKNYILTREKLLGKALHLSGIEL